MLPKHLKSEFLENIKSARLDEDQKNAAEKRIEEAYKNTLISPGEAIGIVTAESFGEPSTQMSISWSEKIIVKIKNRIKIVRIGKFVDDLIKLNGIIGVNNAEILPVNQLDIFVPSINNKEKIKWKKVIECSRHKSPNKLMKLTTKSGRKITATDNHSFVTRINNMVLPVLGSSLKTGSRIPAIKFLPENCISSISARDYASFPLTESFITTLVDRTNKLVPEKFDLDFDFGLFAGYYLASGYSSGDQISIYNVNKNFKKSLKDFTGKIECMEFKRNRRRHVSHYLEVNSPLLAEFFLNTFGTGSSNKKLPDFCYSAKIDFVKGILRGYFDANGNISVNRKRIVVSSNSEGLLDGIKLLLTRVGIFAHKHINNKKNYLLIPYKYANVFSYEIGSDIDYKLESLKKLDDLCSNSNGGRDSVDIISGFGNLLLNVSRKLGSDSRYVNSVTRRQKIGRESLVRQINKFKETANEKSIDISGELVILNQMVCSDVVWDEIISIEYVDSEHEHVYDLSVPGLETFTTFDGIITHNTLNTFHFAGVAEMNVTVGLPRLIELFDARKNPSTPKMEIYLRSKFSRTNDQVREVAMRIKETKLKEIVNEININLPKYRVELSLSKNALRDLGLRTSDAVEKIKKDFRNYDVKDDRWTVFVVSKIKEIELTDLYKLKEKIKNMHILGLKGVTQVLPVKTEGEFVIHCAGSNLKDALGMEEVDPTRIKTNNIHEISEVLGIEAAREAIISEAHNVISDQGLDINIRHIMLLADVMARQGILKGVTRTGLTGEKESVLAKASFETPIKHLIDASLSGEVDELNSVIENVILNQVVPLGTGLPKLAAKKK